MYPSRAHLGQEDGRAWSGPHVKAIKSEKCQGRRPSHSIADVLYRHTCEKGLGGHHTSNRMSSDSLRRGELWGLIRNFDGIYNPPTEGLFGSRKTSLRGTIAYQQLVDAPEIFQILWPWHAGHSRLFRPLALDVLCLGTLWAGTCKSGDMDLRSLSVSGRSSSSWRGTSQVTYVTLVPWRCVSGPYFRHPSFKPIFTPLTYSPVKLVWRICAQEKMIRMSMRAMHTFLKFCVQDL